MTTDAWLWALVLSVFAYWLGRKAGRAHATTIVAHALHRCGVCKLDTVHRTIHFDDGTKHTQVES